MTSGDNGPLVERLWKLLDQYLAVIAAATAVLLGALYLWVDNGWSVGPGSGEATTKTLILGILVGLIPVLIVAVAGYLFLKEPRSLGTTRLTNDIADAVAHRLTASDEAKVAEWNKVPWDHLIPDAAEIEVVTHYLDTWVNNHEEPLTAFFKRGGVVRLVLPDWYDQEVVRRVSHRFPEYDTEQVQKKIANTVRKFEVLAGPETGRVEHVRVNPEPMYTAVRLGNLLVWSPFEHGRRLQVRAPAAILDLDREAWARAWFNNEWETLWERSPGPSAE